ncbi:MULTISPECIES: ABC transporter family substrate-binding protein [Microbacterium]|uniref:Peptide/nickel transport system substrate-binding protein n=1 Tax=Microbacterium saccharophilum TaxID=1213358 RepID=A0A7Z7GC93_9MICO|nr:MULTISPECIES: ABC transporter family substrate-binding protein [Microbacterium]SFI24947.1 peptide/nickel transport system substrate-binding protein [Microbacterium saccharophilum]
MKITRLVAGVGVVAVGALVLSGCTPPRESEVIEGTSITVAWNDFYYAWNDGLADTNATSNAVVNYMAKSGFSYYDADSELVQDTEFGTYELVSEDPLTVKYTINDGVKWTDGTPVDAADLLLQWAANTTHLQDGEGTVDEETGELTGQSGTFWNTGASEDYGLDLVSETPEIGDDGRSITMTYDEFYVDWELALTGAEVAAHGTVMLAYPDEYKEGDEEKAKDDLVKAIQDKDLEWLAPVSKSYNQDYKFSSGTPENPLQLLGNGPYMITEINATDGYTTLEANPDYTWGPSPKYETITVRVIPDMQAQITALENGEISIASGQPTADIASLLEAGVPGVEYEGSPEGTYEHVDLQVTNGGPFDPATYGGDAEKALKVRQAFLSIIPRQEILEKLIQPLQPDAELRNSQIFLPGTPGAEAAAEVNGYPEMTEPDVDGAKALLAEAGATNPTVRLLFSNTNERRKQEFLLIQPYAEAAGFTLVDASRQDWGTALGTATSEYDAALFGWQSTSTAVGESAANYQTGGLNNYYGWSVPELDDIFDELAGTADVDEQVKLQAEAERIIGEQAWSVPIFQFPGITAWSEDTTGVVPGFLSPTYFWNFWEWAPADAAAE